MERYLVTGASGCIGAWILRELLAEGRQVVASDRDPDIRRLQLLSDDLDPGSLPFVELDVTDLAAVIETIRDREITHVIHLAGLQVPFCKADPPRGAQVNVVGTANILEAVRQLQEQVGGLVYASSIAVLGPPEIYPAAAVPDEALQRPDTLYGVYKAADEQMARVYWQDWGIPSVGLRPYIVYGVARDQGMTSDLAKATLAAAAGRSCHIQFGGQVAIQYARDVAQIFIEAVRAPFRGAASLNLRNDVTRIETFVSHLRRLAPGSQITFDYERHLPFPSDLDDRGLRELLGRVPHTPLERAVEETFERFSRLLAADRLDLQAEIG